MSTTFATITLELSKAGIHAICEDTEEDAFIPRDDLQPLVDFINDVEAVCNPDTVFHLTEKGKKEGKRILKEKGLFGTV